MGGCFGSHPIDRHFEDELDRWLDATVDCEPDPDIEDDRPDPDDWRIDREIERRERDYE